VRNFWFNLFAQVATSSALPFLLYNFPGVTGGIDISSDSIIRLAKENSAIVGVK
jgi:2-keto-3-deoxy-L-rhamnonate aldolase